MSKLLNNFINSIIKFEKLLTFIEEILVFKFNIFID